MKCNTCQNENYCYDDNHLPTRDRCTDNGFAAYVPQTNADRIRSMPDEELAAFLFTNVGCSDCTMHGGGCSVDCEKWMLSWLQSPVEVDK